MLSSAAHRLLFAQLLGLGVAAHRDWWLQSLPDCWQSCLSSTDDGCTSTKCICKTTEDSASYLPDAVSCAASHCDADEWALELVLEPLQLYCSAIHSPIPDQVMESASAAATETEEPSQTTPAAQASTQTESEHQTSKGSDDGDDLTSTVKTTITKTTIDADGNTLQLAVPVVIGPTGISTGTVVTSTIDSRASSTGAASSTPASPSPAAEVTSVASTQGPSSTSANSRETERPANGNGSPFENMQAGARRWTVSGPLFGLAALAVLFMRL
ncbi:Nn.00g015570.m01.CDS01 [Neocucurbitaria sp. VM-36]